MLEWIEWIGILPVLGLTGNWRGYRMGGKAIGGASMSTDMKKKFEQARAAGKVDEAKAIADKAQEVKDKKKAEKAAKTIAADTPPKIEYSRAANWLGVMAKDKNFDAKSYIQGRGEGAMSAWKAAHFLLSNDTSRLSPAVIKKFKAVKKMARKLGDIDELADYYEGK